MRAEVESQATPGRKNDDYAAVGLGWAFVLDGATALRPAENGCIHDVPWMVHQLAGNLAQVLTVAPSIMLADALAESITRTCAAHEKTCDLSNPDSPSSTVTILRNGGDVLDYLVLGDSPLLVSRMGKIEPILDERMANLDDYSYEAVIAVQNTPNGYYVANTMPDAAYQAVCGSLPAVEIDSAALLTDGASRLVDAFQLLSWEDLFRLVSNDGPRSLINQTRKVERDGVKSNDGRKRKHHDDATVIFVDLTP
jgi:hypothetical protein